MVPLIKCSHALIDQGNTVAYERNCTTNYLFWTDGYRNNKAFELLYGIEPDLALLIQLGDRRLRAADSLSFVQLLEVCGGLVEMDID